MLTQYYNISHSIFLNHFLQVWLIGNQRYLVPPFIHINRDYEVSCLVIGRKFLRDMKYLIRSVKQTAEAVGIWTGESWDTKKAKSVYTMVSGKFNVKINKRFDSLS